MNKQTANTYSLVLLFLLTSLLIACSATPATAVLPTVPSEPLANKLDDMVVENVHSDASFVFGRDIAEQVANAEIVAIGQLTRMDDVINIAYDNPDNPMPSEQIYVEGQLYTLTIDTMLKSNDATPTTMRVVNSEGFISLDMVADLMDETGTINEQVRQIAQEAYADQMTPLSSGERYLLFLDPLYASEQRFGEVIYEGITQPFAYHILENGRISPISPAQHIPPAFTEIETETELISAIFDALSE